MLSVDVNACHPGEANGFSEGFASLSVLAYVCHVGVLGHVVRALTQQKYFVYTTEDG